MKAPTPASVLVELEAEGITVSTDGIQLTLRGPLSALTSELQARVIRAKAGIIASIALRAVACPKKASNSDVMPVKHVNQTKPFLPPEVESSECPSQNLLASGTSITGLTAKTASDTAPVTQVPPPIIVDFETRAPLSLDVVGGRTYASHPSMEVLCAVLMLPDGAFLEWVPGNRQPVAAFALIAHGVPVMAHNAHGFDRFIWEQLGWPDATWVDSMALARVWGLPGKLESLAEALLDITKDSEGREITLAVGRLDRFGQLPPVTPGDRTAILKYCRKDVLIVRKAWEKELAAASLVEPEVRAIDAVVNERGFYFDRQLAEAIMKCERTLAEAARKNACVDTGVLASPEKLKRALAASGVSVQDVRRSTLLAVLDDPDISDEGCALLTARLASSGIASHKLRAALRRIGADGRVRDTLVYCQAHTGRWAGRGFQPQNLPRGALKSEADIERAIDAVTREDLSTLHDIAGSLGVTAIEICASLVRSCVRATPGTVLGVVDYAQIEARALLWLADDTEALAPFREDVDPYRAMAAQLFGVEAQTIDATQRALGKALVLGCGYQMGAERFESYAAASSVDWSSLDITPETAVNAWRDAHISVAGFPSYLDDGRLIRQGGLWKQMHWAAHQAARGDAIDMGKLLWERNGTDVLCHLPSGRPLVYRDVRLERHTKWGREQDLFTYEHRGQRVQTYGGKLTENVTQAVCRDLLADALVRVDRAGHRIVLHVHDEIVVELAEASRLDDIRALMCAAPPWAEGLPLKAVGYTSSRYRK